MSAGSTVGEGWCFDAERADDLGAALGGFLGSLRERPRLLGLGEPMHGEEEFPRLRNRVFRRLVEREGYRSIAIESDCLAALEVDDFVAGGEGPLDDAMESGFSHGFGKLDANRELVAWMRGHNRDRAPEDRLRFYGFDAPIEVTGAASPRRALAALHGHLAAHLEAALLPCSLETIDGLIGDDGRWTDPAAAMDPSRSVGASREANELRLLADDLLSVLTSESPRLVAASSEGDWWRARLHGRTAAGLLRYHAGMADGSGPRAAQISQDGIVVEARVGDRAVFDPDPLAERPAQPHDGRPLHLRSGDVGVHDPSRVHGADHAVDPDAPVFEACLGDLGRDGLSVGVAGEAEGAARGDRAAPARPLRRGLEHRPEPRVQLVVAEVAQPEGQRVRPRGARELVHEPLGDEHIRGQTRRPERAGEQRHGAVVVHEAAVRYPRVQELRAHRGGDVHPGHARDRAPARSRGEADAPGDALVTLVRRHRGRRPERRVGAPRPVRSRRVRRKMALVLVVEDEAELARLIRRELEAAGHRVLLAEDGEEGLRLHAAEGPEAVVLDWMLPGIDGLEVLRRLRRGAPTPVLMLTARGEEADLVFGLEVGADDYLTKPFSARELVARVRAMLRREGLVREAVAADREGGGLPACRPRRTGRLSRRRPRAWLPASEVRRRSRWLRSLLHRRPARSSRRRRVRPVPRTPRSARRTIGSGNIYTTGRHLHARPDETLALNTGS